MQSLKKFYFGKQKGIPFIIKVNVTSTFTIPTTGSGYNYRVKTSDGQILTNRTANTTITFPSSGIYTIEISGAFPRIYFNNTGDKLLLIDIVQWGSQKWITLERAFYGCSNLKCTAIDYPNLKITTNTSFCFANCTSFGADSDINNIGLWDVSNVTSMSGMFYQATNFNQNIGSWNTSNVTDMSTMFYQATSFNQNIGNWNVSNVTNFGSFMLGKTTGTFSTTNLDAIYNGWSSMPVKTPISISFGTAKYTAASSAGRAILTSAPNNWVITDGGI